MATFKVGQSYTRDEIADHIGMPLARRGGAWDTGYDEWDGQVFIFANVGNAGRTGHNYHNFWQGKILVWYGKKRARRGQTQIDRILSNTNPVHVFWRGRDRSPFTYAGMGSAIEASDDTPVKVLWTFETLGSDEVAMGALAQAQPLWRRGPPPQTGPVTLQRAESPTHVYVLLLDGYQTLLRDTPDGHVVVKVGLSNEIDRRIRELNVGFPPGSKSKWVLFGSRLFPSGHAAYITESNLLERLRASGYWIGGEFAVVPETEIASLLD